MGDMIVEIKQHMATLAHGFQVLRAHIHLVMLIAGIGSHVGSGQDDGCFCYWMRFTVTRFTSTFMFATFARAFTLTLSALEADEV